MLVYSDCIGGTEYEQYATKKKEKFNQQIKGIHKIYIWTDFIIIYYLITFTYKYHYNSWTLDNKMLNTKLNNEPSYLTYR